MSYGEEALNMFWSVVSSQLLSKNNSLTLKDSVDNLFPMIIDKAFNDDRDYYKKNKYESKPKTN